MKRLDQHAREMEKLVQEILCRFQAVNTKFLSGPHAHLNHQELRVVEYLGKAGARSMRDLAGYLSLAVNSVTTIVDGLVDKRLAKRERSSTDRRIVYAELTPSGKKVWNSFEKMRLQLHRTLLSPLTSDEQEIFLVLFRKIARDGKSTAT
ncbi:MarR family winged helix-turn-helix transcriptional regulator [Planctomicrobium sp. SH664]|uniref:MarR family winged helix-turn-helix transcriptional regulator n=1 Tax=Planctomicrobium sp. SH664 TaxID=3448125 RepID=UPI003F5C07D3